MLHPTSLLAARSPGSPSHPSSCGWERAAPAARQVGEARHGKVAVSACVAGSALRRHGCWVFKLRPRGCCLRDPSGRLTGQLWVAPALPPCRVPQCAPSSATCHQSWRLLTTLRNSYSRRRWVWLRALDCCTAAGGSGSPGPAMQPALDARLSSPLPCTPACLPTHPSLPAVCGSTTSG